MIMRSNLAVGVVALIVLCVPVEGVRAQSDVGECSAGPSSKPSATHSALFRISGEERSEADLPIALQQALFDARLEHYKKQLQLIDAAVLESELKRRATLAGKSGEDIAKELFTVAPPDDAAIEAFYQENKARIKHPLEAIRDQIGKMLHERQTQEKQLAFIAKAKQEQVFGLMLEKPIAPYAEILTDGFPSKGALSAKVTIVEFADYQCPHCKRAAGALKQIADRYQKDLRIVFLDFPINPSGVSRVVAEGAACADQQDRFWPYHDRAFEQQSNLSRESPAQIATELALDVDAFQACMKSSLPQEQVAKSEAEARRLGIRSTPTIFLNGRRLHLHDLERELPGEIERVLAAQSKS